MEEFKIIAQTGAAGIGLYFLFLIVRMLLKIVTNHLEHIQRGVESLKETAESHGQKLGSIDGGVGELVRLKKEQLNK